MADEITQKTQIWKNTGDCDGIGEAILVAGGRLGKKAPWHDEAHTWRGRYRLIGRAPQFDKLESHPEFFTVMDAGGLAITELDACNWTLKQGISDMLGWHYPDWHNFEPFGCWRLTLATIHEDHGKQLSEFIKIGDEDEFEAANLSESAAFEVTRSLRWFRSVSVATVKWDAVKSFLNGGELGGEVIEKLRP